MPKRPNKPQGKLSRVRLNGALLSAIAHHSKGDFHLPPTADITDYPTAQEIMVQSNDEHLRNGRSQRMVRVDGYDAKCGVVRVPITVVGTTSEDVVAEINKRFHDGRLSLAAAKETSTDKDIQGGWLVPYLNTLSKHEGDQQKSVLAVSSKSFKAFKSAMPHLNDVVQAVKKDITSKHNAMLGGTLEAVEYTLFFGTTPASCTKWHTDCDEHPNSNLVFTSLTLLTAGPTSMCIAGKDETHLGEPSAMPFDTVLFDAELWHRSGLTHHHVIKLSIHWKVVSSGASCSTDVIDLGSAAAGSGTPAVVVKLEGPAQHPPLLPAGTGGSGGKQPVRS